jgi:hypothetical protein
MTGSTENSLYDEYASSEEGARELAAVDLANQVSTLIRQAADASPIDQRTLAVKLGVTEGRVSQVINGDGNLRVAAVAKYLRALGYVTRLVVHPAMEGLPELPRKQSQRPKRNRLATKDKGPSKGHGERFPYLGLFEAEPLPSPLISEPGHTDEAEIQGSPQLYFELPAGSK